MEINYCLILAAGLGTRMGEIGKKWPKVLWPVFEKSLLSLQVSYAKYLGIKKIYINLFNMSELILEESRKDPVFTDVIFLKESPEILDIGGAVHNLARQEEVNYSGNLLLLNADQFLFIKKEDFSNLIHSLSGKILLCQMVSSSLGYNALKVESNSGLVQKIIPNQELPTDIEMVSYTGNAILDLTTLKPKSGPSKFFDSVCSFEDNDVFIRLVSRQEYWDFGTTRRYWETLRKILRVYKEHSLHPFIRFLVENKSLKTWKINLKNLSYHASSSEVINLNQAVANLNTPPAILISGFPENIPGVEYIFKDGDINYLEK